MPLNNELRLLPSIRSVNVNLIAKRKFVPWIFLLPFLTIFVVFKIYPTLYSMYVSFTSYRGGHFIWAGTKNFKFIVSDPIFKKSIYNTFIILLIQVPIQTFLALVLASLLNIPRMKMKGLFRMMIFMPVLIDTVSYSIVFLLFFNNSSGGLCNSLLGLCGISPLQWMNKGILAKIVIIAAVTWRWTGYNMVIILGGLQNVSQELYDAASIDGASKIKKFFSITIPSIRPVLVFSVIFSVNGILQLFTEPDLITKGGPINETLTVVQYLYNVGFTAFNYGVASAGAYILAIIIGFLTFIQLRVTREK